MRVLIFCQLFPPITYGGGEILLWNLAKTLASRGHEVHVITQRVKGEKDSETIQGVNIWRVGLPVEYTGALTTRILESVAYLVDAFFLGIRIAAHRRVDIIHSNTYVPVFVGQLCAFLLKKKHVMTVHDVYLLTMPWFWEKWSRQPKVSFAARLLGPFIERGLLGLPLATIHTVSETSKGDLLRVGTRNRIIVVPNGIDPNDYQPDIALPEIPHQVIYIGRLVFYKNLETVLSALTEIISTVPDAKLIIVGDGPMKKEWQKMTELLRLQEHVQFCGRVTHQEKVRLLKQSAFLILPSLVEGFGIVILEAFACKKPVLVSRIGALEELVADGENGYLVDPLLAEDWAEKMQALFSDRALASRMGDNCYRKLAERYTAGQVARQVETMYMELLKEHIFPM